MSRTTIITCALPYANGSIHLGHMVEHIQTDIYVRFLRSCGENVVFLCADDTHGTAIELSAEKAGITPEQFIAKVSVEHQKDFADFEVKFDAYHSTHSPENKHYAELIYSRLKEAGLFERKEVEQPYDAKANRFLPDRYIRGTCPNCKTKDQYGDACENCLATYTPKELIDPRSAISGEALQWKKSEHLFLSLQKVEEFLKKQIDLPGFMDAGQSAKLKEFFTKGLKPWDMTRDGPYFGFPIPGETNKFFYVWLDAPIGYIASTELWAKQRGETAMKYWEPGTPARVIHVIGKDIVYFHCLFWPAMLNFSHFKVPEHVHIHGHLTVNGAKMAKSTGTFINARPYLDLLDPSYLRFFYASVLGPGPEDLDLDLKAFRERVNGELVNNLGNLANRRGSMLGESLAPASTGEGKALVEAALDRVHEIRNAFEKWDYRAAIKAILEIGSKANEFLTKHEPWKKIKTDPEAARSALSDAAEVSYLVGALIEPVVPRLSAKLFDQLNAPPLTFAKLEGAKYPLLDRSRPLKPASPLIGRIEQAVTDKLVVAPAAKAEAPAKAKAASAAAAPAGPPPEIEYGDFAKVELKVGKIVAAVKVPKKDKLLQLTVDLGEAAPRTIVSGIAEAYAAEAVVGKNVVVVANLKPRALAGIESKGMLLTAGPGGKELVLLDPGNMKPGSEVK